MPKSKHQYLSWAEIDLKAVRHNYRLLREMAVRSHERTQIVPPRKKGRRPVILTVIKADAYGHGMLQTAGVLDRMGVRFFGVSDPAEGILLRQNGFEKPVLLFESTLPGSVKEIMDFNLTPTVCSVTMASALNNYAKALDKPVRIHVKVDTGMGRLGVWHRDALSFIREIHRYRYLTIEGLYTHFPLADSRPDFTRQQIKQLTGLVHTLDREGLVVPYIHAANSMGLAAYQSRLFNLFRPGLMLYGLSPSKTLKKTAGLKPAMTVKSRVIFVKDFARGQGISYGHTFVARKSMSIATLPIGYSDGYMRCLSNKAGVLINGKRCPVVGNITMDQTMVDVTALGNVKLGTEAVILGTQNAAAVSADDLADLADTINYEIVCSLGSRLPRVYQ